MRLNSKVYAKLVTVIFLFIFSGQHMFCGKKEVPFEPTDPLGIANKWVYDSMKLYYYWNDQVPGKPDYSLPTADFFKKLLSKNDRFSLIANRNTGFSNRTSFWIYGFHYALITHPFDANQLIGVITMVVPGCAAEGEGLKRGVFFTTVNGILINSSNIEAIKEMMGTGGSIRLGTAALNGNGTGLKETGTVTVQGGHVPVLAIHASRLFEKNGVKAGYLSYVLCEESQDGRLLQHIQKLKNAGVTELVLDLRFNPGGSVASSAKLAAMLVPSFKPDQVYVTFKGNKHGGTVKQTFRQTIDFSYYSEGKDMQYLASLNLGLKRVFILTSDATVSAAEILCNNLKPYIQVIRIGEKTHGKDEASFRIEDSNNPRKSEYILLPTIYKIYDANDKGGYSAGLAPDHAINDFASLPLQELGMPGDAALDKALQLVYGTSDVIVTPLRKAAYQFPDLKIMYHSATGASAAVEFKR